MIKVYQINVVCGTGSTGRIVEDLKKHLEKEGNGSRIAYGRGKVRDMAGEVKIGTIASVLSHAALARLTGKQGLYSLQATKFLIRDILNYKPDIIHLHNIHGYYLNYEVLFHFLSIYSKPVIWTMHDCWAFTGHCAHYDQVKCMQWKKRCVKCPALNVYPATLTGRNITSNFLLKKRLFSNLSSLTIVTPSNWLKDQVSASFLSDIPCIVVHNGIDLKKFYPHKNHVKKILKCENKTLLLGVAGVWTEGKGLKDFLALRRLLDDQYMICMIGLTAKQKEQLPNGIIGICRTENIDELAKFYSAADVFLNLSYEDTFSTTNIEALACGTPVITYQTGGSPEILDETCGVIVEKGNMYDLVKGIKSIKKKKFNKLACLKRSGLFRNDTCYDKYLELYTNVLKNERVRRHNEKREHKNYVNRRRVL